MRTKFAITAALAVAACAAKGHGGGDGNKIEVAHITVKKFAFEAYAQWAAQHPDKQCPGSLTELTPFMNSDDVVDPWGNPYVMLCGPAAPPGAKGMAVVSYGADGKPGGTGDAADISSADSPP